MIAATVTHKATSELGSSVQIVDGKPSLIYCNASLITSADHNETGGCLRRVWYEKVGGRGRVETEAQRAGTDMHTEIEHYELTGENVLGPLAASGRKFIPKVWEEPTLYKVEHPIVHHKDGKITRAWLYADDVPAAGHIDLVNISGRYIDENGEERREQPGVIEIKDWKTTSDMKWAKTAQQVAETIQMNTYGAWALGFYDMIQPVERVRLTHVYFQKKRPHQAALRTSIRTAEQIESKWKYSTSIVRTIRDAIKETEAIKVPGNAKACYSYNSPCPHLGVCSVGSHDSLEGIFKKVASDFKIPTEEQAMGFLSDNNLIPGAAPSVHTPVAPTPAQIPQTVLPPQPDMRAQLQAEEERLRAQQQALQTAAPVQMDLKQVWERIQQHGRGTPQLSGNAAGAIAQAYNIALTPGAGLTGAGDLAGINLKEPANAYQLLNELEQAAARNGANPNAAQIIPVQVTQAPPVMQAPVTVMTNTGTPVVITHLPPQNVVISNGSNGLLPPDAPALNQATASAGEKPAPVAAENAGEPAKKRGRPPKAQEPSMNNVLASAPEQTQAVSPPPPSTTPTAPTAAGADALSSTPAAKRLEVYVNCLPMHRAKPLAGYVDMLNEQLSKRYCDANAIQDIRCADPKGPLGYGGWRAALREVVIMHPPPDDVYMITTGDELAEVVANALQTVCAKKNGLYARGLGGK